MRRRQLPGLLQHAGPGRLIRFAACIGLGLFAQAVMPESTPPEADIAPRVAIVIDDLGDRMREGRAVIELPGAITVGIIPFTPYATRLGELADRHDKELILHVPMEAIEARYLGRAGLHTDMSQEEFNETLQRGLLSLPNIRGVNNHMGSRLTQDPLRMQWLMAGLLRFGELYFVDSRTTHHSVALQQAHAIGIDSTSRDVFLDHDRTPERIQRQWRYLLQLARERGSALAIGHPYPETIAFLRRTLPELDKAGIRLVSVSELIASRKTDRRLAWQTNPSSSRSPRAAKSSRP